MSGVKLLVQTEHFKCNHRCEKFMTYVEVMFGQMMFGLVVGVVRFSRMPVDAKLLLTFMVLKPMEAHVHCLSAFGLDFTIDDSISHGIVSLERGGWLHVS